MKNEETTFGDRRESQWAAPVLPLKKQGKIALIGPLADNRSNMVGCWSTGDTPELYSTLKEAMERQNFIIDNLVIEEDRPEEDSF